MPDNRTIILDRQRRAFRIACDPMRYALTIGVIAADSGIGYDSLRNYAAGKTEMPVSALFALAGVIDDELLSLFLPAGKQIVTVPDTVDHFEAARAMADYLRAKTDAHHPDSEAGEAIGPTECANLRGKLAAVPTGAA